MSDMITYGGKDHADRQGQDPPERPASWSATPNDDDDTSALADMSSVRVVDRFGQLKRRSRSAFHG
jgi:hypothetical protein